MTDFVLGSMKHIVADKVSRAYTPEQVEHAVILAWDNLTQALTRWNDSAADAQSKYTNYSMKSHIKVGRSPKTGKILVSESRNQQRAGHQTFAAASIKGQLPQLFLDLEKALLSYPAFASTNVNLMVHFRHGEEAASIMIQDYSITHWNKQEQTLDNLLWIMRRLDGIVVKNTSQQWMVGSGARKQVVAQTPLEAAVIDRVLNVAADKEKREKKLRAPFKGVVAVITPQEEYVQDFKQFFKEQNA